MPKVVSETRKRIEDMPPPDRRSLLMHEWLPDIRRREYVKRFDARKGFELYISERAADQIKEHCMKYKTIEVMGFLIGNIYTHRGKTYTVVTDIATGDLEASDVSVKFDRSQISKLFRSLDMADGLILGWYHSHPGHNCFMSEQDIKTQKRMFSEYYHCAIVVDPNNREIAAYKLDGRKEYRDLPFALFDSSVKNDEGEAAEFGRDDKASEMLILGASVFLAGAVLASLLPYWKETQWAMPASILGALLMVLGGGIIARR